MTRLLYLPDDATVIHLDVELDAAQLVAAVNSGMRPLPLLRSAPPGKLTACEFGRTVVVAPGVVKRKRGGGEANAAGLSRRQLQVHELAIRGLSSGEIALLLRISRRTVNYHLSQAKTRIHQGAQAPTRVVSNAHQSGDSEAH